MTAYPDPTVVADGSKGVRGALEAVEGVRISSGHNHLEGLVVLVATNLALSHSYHPFLLIVLGNMPAPLKRA